MTDIILASKSPRRKELLEKINLKFKIIESKYIEKKALISQDKYCIEMAHNKALDVAKNYNNSLIIGADTIVSFKNKILGKPKNMKEAKKYLKLLSNNTHNVYTGVSLLIVSKNINLSFFEKTEVTFNNLNNKDIDYYIDSFKPMDKAGAYGIQDAGSIMIKKINGCFYNVVGFPLSKFYKLASGKKIINNIIKLNIQNA
jgi:septum formation protein